MGCGPTGTPARVHPPPPRAERVAPPADNPGADWRARRTFRRPGPRIGRPVRKARRASSWDHQFLAGLDFIRVAELVPIGFEDFHVIAGVTVDLFAYFG